MLVSTQAVRESTLAGSLSQRLLCRVGDHSSLCVSCSHHASPLPIMCLLFIMSPLHHVSLLPLDLCPYSARSSSLHCQSFAAAFASAACSAISTPYLAAEVESSRHRGRHRERLKSLLYHNLSRSQIGARSTSLDPTWNTFDASTLRQSLKSWCQVFQILVDIASARICIEAKRRGSK